MASTTSMSLKDWVDLFTGGGAAISAIAAGVAAWAARTSARAAKESSEATRAAIRSNEKIAENDRRIRLMEERLSVWRAFDELMITFLKRGKADRDDVAKAQKHFQFALFLFDPEIDNYLRDLNYKVLRHNQLNEWMTEQALAGQFGKEPDPTLERKAEERMRLEQWLIDQQHAGKRLFRQHMSLIESGVLPDKKLPKGG